MELSFLLIINIALMHSRVCSHMLTPPSSFVMKATWFRKEHRGVSRLKERLHTYLEDRKIVDAGYLQSHPFSQRSGLSGTFRQYSTAAGRVAVSTASTPYECRLTLDTVPYGRKVVSPCNCTGTQKWIQFSKFNRARRIHPADWRRCSTCQSDIDYTFLPAPRVKTFCISSLLDNKILLRLFLVSVGAVMTIPLSQRLTHMVLTSSFFWQQYPSWVIFYNFPFMAKLWIFQEIIWISLRVFQSLEIRILEFLSDMETRILEPLLEESPDMSA
mmetsp:Transcript_6944/g.13278  ORF Transcript_6944/g.13278 Transcript_6944/m.13278 type:complete len:272 (+) Transcript_6944:13-828(+)